jgi:hypothetical protein
VDEEEEEEEEEEEAEEEEEEEVEERGEGEGEEGREEPGKMERGLAAAGAPRLDGFRALSCSAMTYCGHASA